MGKKAVKAINHDPELQLAGKLGRQDHLAEAIKSMNAQVVVDFTTPSVVYDNALTMLENDAHPVIGTSGLSSKQINDLQNRYSEKQLGGIIAPNFSIGAILMMRYARDAARYFSDVEIIELHHDKKIDAPSGTAMKTASMIAENRTKTASKKKQHELIPGARGGLEQHVPIHSVRLPGLVAHQMVIFGGQSETLTIRHDSIHREAFMPGVILACKKVVHLKHLAYGLENVLD